MPEFPHLMSPGRIGTMALRNRILMCPMGDSLANDDGTVSDVQLAYYGARARGGAALILVGSVSVAYPAGSFAATQTAASDDAQLPGLRALADRVHAHGARIAAQLSHGGPQSLHDIETGRPMLLPAPPRYKGPDRIARIVTEAESEAMARPFTAPTSRVDLHVADDDDLAWAIERYADAAARVQRAGFDGVELHAGHGYLLDAFRSPSTNTRDDAWGGDLEGRTRLLFTVVRAVRDRVGPDFPLWCRLNAFERHRDPAETLEETLTLAPRLVDAGLDALHVSAYADPSVGVGITDAHTPHTPGALVAAAAAVRAVVDVPVITFGRLEPEDAEAALARGAADLVGMGRKLLADPDLPAKLASGRVDDVRPCAYQYRCIGNIFLNTHVTCVANPETAREEALAVPTAARPRRVLVVGGGPAGLETAWRLATSGHAVELWEAGPRLGGRLAIAAGADAPLDALLGWLLRAVERAGVEIRLGTRADVESIAAAGFDDVVVATGALWGRPPIPGADSAQVLTLDDVAPWVAEDGDAVGARVVVLGGGKAGITLAALAARRGRSVAVVEPSGVFGVELGLPGRFRWIADLEAAGVELHGGATPVRIDADAVVVTGADDEETALVADTVLLAWAPVPDRTLVDALTAHGVRVHGAGDCVEVRRLEGALLDAAHLTVALAD